MQNFHFHAPSTKFPNFPIINRRHNANRQGNENVKIHHPRSEFITKWNNIFLIVCLISLFLDPIFFYVPTVCGEACIETDLDLLFFIMWLRTVCDSFYAAHIYIKFKTAFVNPSSRVFGRGEIVMDPKAIAIRYLKRDFIIDFSAMLPLPQILLWFVYPSNKDRSSLDTNYLVAAIILIQYIPRLCVMLPLNKKIADTTGIVAKNAFSGAIYNLVLFTLAGHVVGAIWYLWALDHITNCWEVECNKEAENDEFPCFDWYFDKKNQDNPERQAWAEHTGLFDYCSADSDNPKAEYEFGIFGNALESEIFAVHFWGTYFYCLWWGLQNLGSYGQNLETTTERSQNIFAIFVGALGLFLFALLIGQVQNYLQSIMVRIEEWRVQRRDTEEWMQHRQLPEELRERIRRFDQYKWLAARGVDEREILQELPLDLRREIQKHLCLKLVRRVPFFAQMDDQLLDAICERLQPSLSTKDTNIVREGDPVTEMLFIIRGRLESSTTYGGRTGFFDQVILRQGDFCGEELLTWAVLPSSTDNLPSSTRTVKALTDVEAFALQADDLKYVATQFKRLQSKKIQHAFRYYSHQWRTWGACFIQAAWRRYKKKKMAEELVGLGYYYSHGQDDDDIESNYSDEPLLQHDVEGVDQNAPSSSLSENNNNTSLAATLLASKFAANARKGASQRTKIIDATRELKLPKMFKPEDPDFSSDI